MKSTSITSIIIGCFIVSIFSIGVSFAFAETVLSVPATKTAETKSVETTSADENAPMEKEVAPYLEPVKKSALSIFDTIENWRLNQEKIWRAIRTEKEQEIDARNEIMDDKIMDRSEKVLNEEQSTVVTGAGNDFDGKILLLKLYTAVLSLFVVIFSSKALFCIILVLIVGMTLSSIIGRLRSR
jgi:hypothetical protein